MSSKSMDFSVSGNSFFNSCFMCGELIRDLGIKLLDTKTTYMKLALPHKLGHVIGNEYIIVVSNEDKICNTCYCLINCMDELEFNLLNIKQRVVQLLEFTHKLDQLVDTDIPESDLICSRNFDSCVSASSETKLSQDNCSLSKNKIDSVSLLSEKSNEPFFCNETSIEDDLTLHINIIQDEKESLACNSQPVLRTINKNEVCNQISDLCILDNNVEKNFFFKEDSSINNENLNDSSSGKIYSESPLNDTTSNRTSQFPGLNEEIVKCKITSKDVRSQHSDNEPLEEKLFVCKICDILFTKQHLLSHHTRLHQRNLGKVKCSTCNLECHDHLHYFYHCKSEHDPLKRLSCPLCNKNFASNQELRSHVLKSHEGERINCDKCGEKFKRLIHFQNHKLYSHGNRNCRICDKHIPSVFKLRQHENRHMSIDFRKLKCDVCGRIFKTSGVLRVHKLSHTRNYNFFCEFCGSGFMSSILLKEHKRVHTKEETSYVCVVCARKFLHYSTFHLHKQWHKNPFPFQCNFCKKKFRYRSVHSNHIRRDHAGESIYKCHFCGTEFLKFVFLKKHIRMHTKEYPFNCNNCEKSFFLKRSLERHMARMHYDKSLK